MAILYLSLNSIFGQDGGQFNESIMVIYLGRKHPEDLLGNYTPEKSMNAPLARLSRTISSTLKLESGFTGKIRVQFEFREGSIVQMRRLHSEQVIDLSKMRDDGNQNHTGVINRK